MHRDVIKFSDKTLWGWGWKPAPGLQLHEHHNHTVVWGGKGHIVSKSNITLIMTKTEYLLDLLRSLEAQVANRASANRLIETINHEGGAKDLITARKKLSQDPDSTKLPELYGEIKAAVDAYNAVALISIPTLEEVVAGIAAADSAEA